MNTQQTTPTSPIKQSKFQQVQDKIADKYGEIWLPLLGSVLGGLLGFILFGWGVMATMDLWFVKRYHNKYPTYRYLLNLVAIAISSYLMYLKFTR